MKRARILQILLSRGSQKVRQRVAPIKVKVWQKRRGPSRPLVICTFESYASISREYVTGACALVFLSVYYRFKYILLRISIVSKDPRLSGIRMVKSTRI